MREWVVGFMFDEAAERVVLVRKNRPEWQKGRYNGVGGKVEPGESPHEAMDREFGPERMPEAMEPQPREGRLIAV